MSVSWTIKYGSTTKSASDWGMDKLSLRLNTQNADTLTFIEPLQDATVEDTFAENSILTLYRDGVKWFEGILTSIVPAMADMGEVKSYIVQGGWYYLDNHVFKQTWKSYTGDPDNLGEVKSSHVFLGMSNDLGSFQKQNSKEQIQESLDYAIASGAPIAYDLSQCPAIAFPVDEKRDITCGDAIRQVLRWVPDAVTWWDYSQTVPTLHIARRADLALFTLPGFDGQRVKRIAPIALRSDLKRPAVVFRFESTNSANGTAWLEHVDDVAPEDATGDELKALVMTISLQGYTASFSTAQIITEQIQKNSVDWWKARITWLQDPEIVSAVLSGTTREGELLYELIDGSYAEWMDDQGFSAEADTVEADITVTYADGTKKTDHISVNLNTTDAPSGTYTNADSFEEGEPAPIGLAQVFYDALNRDEYEGELALIEQDCVGDLSVGNRLRITGGKEGWATMDAIVYQVTFDIDAGITEVSFGPPPYLSVGDLMDLLRVNRTRFNYTSRNQRLHAKAGRDTSVNLPKQTAKQNSTSGTKLIARQIFSKYESNNLLVDSSQYVDIDAEQAKSADGTPRPLTIREVTVCTDGTSRKMLVLASEEYDA